MAKSLFQEVRANKVKSVVIMLFFLVMISCLGVLAGAIYGDIYFGAILAIIISFIYLLIGYYSGDSMILSMSGAKEATKKEYPHLVNTVEGLATAPVFPPLKLMLSTIRQEMPSRQEGT